MPGKVHLCVFRLVNAFVRPEHPISQGGAQSGGAKVSNVPSVQTFLCKSNANHHLIVVDVQQHLTRNDIKKYQRN